MTRTAPVVRVHQTCIAAPSQWLAWTADGTQLYLRYRHGRGRVEVGDGMRLQPVVLTRWDDRGGSFITLEDFMAKAELTLADGAEVRPLPDDPDDALPDPAAAGEPTQPAAAAPQGPVPFLQGSFALYQTPEGGAVLAYRAKGSSEDRQLMIPPFILSMAGQASGLSPDAILSRLQSGDIDG